jgi:hypothetical protein
VPVLTYCNLILTQQEKTSWAEQSHTRDFV